MINLINFPSQKKSFKQKDKKWKEDCVKYVVSVSNSDFLYKRKSKIEKQVNYDLVNGIIDKEDFKHIIDPYNLKDEFGGTPAKFNSYPLIQTILNEISGNELKRRFRFRAICTGGKGQEIKEELKMKGIQSYFKNKIYNQLKIDPENLPQDFQEPEQIKEFYNFKYEDIREIYANKILKHLEYDQNLKHKFKKGFTHAQIVAEEIYNVIKFNDKPDLRVIDTRYFWFLKTDESDFIEDSIMCCEEIYWDKNYLIDFFGDELTPDIIDKIDTDFFKNNSVFSFNSIINSESNTNKDMQGTIQIFKVCWKSLKEVQMHYYIDEFGKQQIKSEDEFFVLSKEEIANKDYIKKVYKTEVWEGYLLNENIIIGVKPCEVQNEGKLPYIGAVYNDLNSRSTSIVDYLKVYQHTYNMISYKLELEFAKAQGKKIFMDYAQIPRTEGWSDQKWMYYFNNLNVVFYNSKEEGMDQNKGQSGFKDVDLSLSSTINGYFTYLNKIEQMMYFVSGVSPQRLGTISPYETSSGISQAIQQSNTITEPFFYMHSIVKRNVLSYLVQFSRFCYKEDRNKKLSFLNSDLVKDYMEIDTNEMEDSDFGVFISDATQDEQIFDMIKQNAQQAIQSGALAMSDLMNIMNSNSVSEITNMIKKAEKEREESKNYQFEQEQKRDQERIVKEEENKFKEKEFELLKQKNEADLKIRLKEMDNELEFSKLNGTPNYQDYETNLNKENNERDKISLQQNKNLQENSNKGIENIIKAKELDLKNKDIDAKIQIAKENKNKYDKK